jgi:hypothetical protein
MKRCTNYFPQKPNGLGGRIGSEQARQEIQVAEIITYLLLISAAHWLPCV